MDNLIPIYRTLCMMYVWLMQVPLICTTEMGAALEVLVTSEWDPLEVKTGSGSSLEGTLSKKQGEVCDDIVKIPEPDAVAMVADSGVGTVTVLKQHVSPQPRNRCTSSSLASALGQHFVATLYTRTCKKKPYHKCLDMRLILVTSTKKNNEQFTITYIFGTAIPTYFCDL